MSDAVEKAMLDHLHRLDESGALQWCEDDADAKGGFGIEGVIDLSALAAVAVKAARDGVGKPVDTAVIKVLSDALDDLIGICRERQPTPKEIARARAYLPPSSANAYPKKARR